MVAGKEAPRSTDIMKHTVQGFYRIGRKYKKTYIKRRVRKSPETYVPFTVAPVTVDLKIRSPKHIIQNRIKSFRAILCLLFIPVTHSSCYF